MARDSQKERVYRAERAAPRGTEYSSLDEVLAYADSVIRSDWWALNSKTVGPITIVERNHRRGKAWYQTALITLPRFAWYQRYVLHELAHLAHGLPHSHEAGHGTRYVQVFHSMIEYFMGMEEAAAFRRGCLRHGIATGLPTMHHDHIHPTAANRWYEASYLRYRQGLRRTPPALRKGMTQAQAVAIRARVDRGFELQGAAGDLA